MGQCKVLHYKLGAKVKVIRLMSTSRQTNKVLHNAAYKIGGRLPLTSGISINLLLVS